MASFVRRRIVEGDEEWRVDLSPESERRGPERKRRGRRDRGEAKR